MLYLALVKLTNENRISILYVDTDEKKLNKLKEKEALQQIKSLNGIETIHSILPEKISNNTYCILKSNELISNRLTLYKLENDPIIQKGWVFNTVINNIEKSFISYYDVIPINEININTDDRIYEKNIYDVYDESAFRKRKLVEHRDGDSLFNPPDSLFNPSDSLLK
jgi:hypothetical protein